MHPLCPAESWICSHREAEGLIKRFTTGRAAAPGASWSTVTLHSPCSTQGQPSDSQTFTHKHEHSRHRWHFSRYNPWYCKRTGWPFLRQEMSQHDKHLGAGGCSVQQPGSGLSASGGFGCSLTDHERCFLILEVLTE